MLRIHTVTSAAAAKNYYQTSDYYSEGQETIGYWGGKLAPLLGLEGQVRQQELERLCDNLHPMTGERLTARTNDKRRVGYDFTIDAAKSFSVLVAMAPEDLRSALMQAFNDAIRETAERDIEPDMQTRVRLDGQDTDRTTGNALWAWFGHTTSRPVDGQAPDPQIHAHLLFFNATEDPMERRIKAGQFAGIKRDGEYFHALIMSRLASKLEALGVAIERRGDTRWEIAGMPQSVIDKFSKRSATIESEHQARMLSDPDYRPEEGSGNDSVRNGPSPSQLLHNGPSARATSGVGRRPSV